VNNVVPIFFIVFLPLILFLEEVNLKVKNVGAPAEGNLHLEGVWPMGLRLGFVASSQLAAGIPVGMAILTLFWYLPLLPLFCTVVPVSVRL
jgi:hypothetical protein